jgi:hypothetical protein
MTNYTTLSTSIDNTTSMTLSPPANTSIVFIYGLVDPFSTGSYTVTSSVNGESTAVGPSSRTFNASSQWVGANQVFYQAKLDVGVQHSVKLTFHIVDPVYNSGFNLASVVYLQVPG